MDRRTVPDIFRLVDRRGADHLLAPTHEELFTLLAKAELASYRDLPLSLYQVQTKFRDEPRPRSGLLRTREFLMKDSYSFDLDDDGLAASYAAHREAYQRIFARLGLEYRIVAAMSGAMGGSVSEEFLAADAGRRGHVRSTARQCGYAANTEAVPSPRRTAPIAEPGPVEELDTPDTPTIETLAAHLGVPASATLKNLLVAAPGDELVAIGVPGDREVDLRRVEARSRRGRCGCGGGRLRRPPGAGPRATSGRRAWPAAPFRYLADPRVAPGHLLGDRGQRARPARPQRGRRPRLHRRPSTSTWSPCVDGDPCPRCGGPLDPAPAASRSGTSSSSAASTPTRSGWTCPARTATPVRPTMGSYGIGVQPGGRGDRRAAPRRARAGLAARRSPRTTCTWCRSAAATSRRTRGTWPTGWPTTGLRVLRRRPAGRLGRGQAHRRRADRRADGRSWSAGALGEGVVEVRDRRPARRRDDPGRVVLAVTR